MQWVPSRLLPLWAPKLPILDRALLPDVLRAIDSSNSTTTAAKKATFTVNKWQSHRPQPEPIGWVAIDMATKRDGTVEEGNGGADGRQVFGFFCSLASCVWYVWALSQKVIHAILHAL